MDNSKYDIDYDDEMMDDDDNSQKDKYITFKLGFEIYAIGIEYVKEIIGLQNITHLPDTADYIKGVINLRGSIIPIVDMRLRFCLEKMPYGDRTCIIVLNIEEKLIGLIVDEVSEVLDVPGANVDPPPSMGMNLNSDYIQGIGKLKDIVIIILNAFRIFSNDELNHMALNVE